MKRGWFRESYRHSLASKGIRTSLVANSRKGNRTKVEDLVWDDKKQRWVDWRKVASAHGIQTGNKRKAMKKGDTISPIEGINIYEGLVEAERQPAFTEFEYMPRQVTLPVTPPIVQEFEYPAQKIGSLLEQQAQPVEDGLPEREVSSPQSITAFSSLPKILNPDEAVATAPRSGMAAKEVPRYFIIDMSNRKIFFNTKEQADVFRKDLNERMAIWPKLYESTPEDIKEHQLKIRLAEMGARNEYVDHAGSVYGGDL